MSLVKIKQTSVNIPTYKWGNEDVEPPLIREFTPRGQPIYPYTTQEIVSQKKSLCRYKAIILENEYLKLTFLPELNGRLYSAFDKISKKEIFYNNQVVKPALFGLRGVWAAVGIEYNFPNSHSTTALEPISWKTKRYKDGSASFIAGDIEWVSRMGWSVEVRLEPGNSSIKMESKLYNFTEFPQRFYYWVNASVPVYPQSQFIYPPSMHRLYTHPPMDISRLAFIDYPVHRGRDISFFGNIPQQFSIFATLMEEDFFGIYHHNLGAGLVHIADHSLVRGRKTWTFGTSRDGRLWIDLLTDTDGDYAELQSGPFTLQSDYRMLAPGTMHLQKDVWYPVVGLGGFNAASGDIAANIKVEKKRVKVLVNSTREIQLKVQLVKGKDLLDEKNISIIPLALKTVEFPLSSRIKPEEIEINFLDESGNKILQYKDKQNRRPGQDKRNSTNACSSLDRMYLKGHYLEEQGYPKKAIKIYSEREKDNLKAKISRARLMAKSGNSGKALSESQKILTVAGEDSDALYISGICLRNLRKFKEGEKAFSLLMDNNPSGALSLFHLAKISMMQKDYLKALSRLEKCIGSYPMASYPLCLRALCFRKINNQEKARQILTKAEETFGFDPLIWGELFLINQKETGSKILLTRTPQQIIEIVCRYMDIEELEDSLRIVRYYLKEARDLLPILFYYQGYLEDKLGMGKKAKRSFTRGKRFKAKWDFVFRIESEKILKKALAFIPDDHNASYQLGNLLAFKGRWEEAVSFWQKVKGTNLSCALRNQGLFWWQIKNRPKKAIKKYNRATSIKDCGAKTIWEYDHVLEEINYHQERLKLLRKNRKILHEDRRLLLRLASALLASGFYEETIDILRTNEFPLCEGKVLPRLLYEEACCALGENYKDEDIKRALDYYKMPLVYPENLGVGKPSRNMGAEWWYRAGRLLKETSDISQAKKFFKSGAQKGDGIDVNFFPLKDLVWEHGPDTIDIYYWINEFFRALCLREIGKEVLGKQILKKMHLFIKSKIKEGRTDELELKLIEALIFYARGNKKKARAVGDPLPNNKIPYSRIRNFMR